MHLYFFGTEINTHSEHEHEDNDEEEEEEQEDMELDSVESNDIDQSNEEMETSSESSTESSDEEADTDSNDEETNHCQNNKTWRSLIRFTLSVNHPDRPDDMDYPDSILKKGLLEPFVTELQQTYEELEDVLEKIRGSCVGHQINSTLMKLERKYPKVALKSDKLTRKAWLKHKHLIAQILSKNLDIVEDMYFTSKDENEEDQEDPPQICG